MGKYRNYSDDDKATALAFYDACNNLTMTARECKMPLATVALWVKERDTMPSSPSPESVSEKRVALADVLEDLAYLAAGQSRTAMGDASAAQAATVLGISIDKMRLLRELPTSITQSSEPKSVQERDELLITLLTEIEKRDALEVECRSLSIE